MIRMMESVASTPLVRVCHSLFRVALLIARSIVQGLVVPSRSR
jgi:hypothetical protein